MLSWMRPYEGIPFEIVLLILHDAAKISTEQTSMKTESGLAPRIFFIFSPFLREGGGGVRGEGGNSSKIRGKRGTKGGGERRGRCRKRVRAFFGGRGP